MVHQIYCVLFRKNPNKLITKRKSCAEKIHSRIIVYFSILFYFYLRLCLVSTRLVSNEHFVEIESNDKWSTSTCLFLCTNNSHSIKDKNGFSKMTMKNIIELFRSLLCVCVLLLSLLKVHVVLDPAIFVQNYMTQ